MTNISQMIISERKNVMKTLSVFCVFVLAVTFWAMPIFAQDLREGLVGYWKLDETSGTTARDSSGNGHDGTFVGDPQWVDGKINGALELDGTDDYVNMDGYKGIMESPWTVACWIKTTAGGAMDIVSWGTEGGGLKVEFRLDEGLLRIEHGNGNIRGDAITNDGEWHHGVAQAPEGITIKDVLFYLDGALLPIFAVGNGDNPFNITEGEDFNIGRSGPRGDRHFTGMIDEVMFYNRILTQEEIARVMEGEVLAVELGDKLATKWGVLKTR